MTYGAPGTWAIAMQTLQSLTLKTLQSLTLKKKRPRLSGETFPPRTDSLLRN
jgi:hypothetical protein